MLLKRELFVFVINTQDFLNLLRLRTAVTTRRNACYPPGWHFGSSVGEIGGVCFVVCFGMMQLGL